MNKAELINKIAEDVDVSKAKASEFIESFINIVVDAAKKDDKITLVGFGSFMVSKRQARQGRNPQTGKTINIPASNVPKFVPGKAFKDAIN